MKSLKAVNLPIIKSPKRKKKCCDNDFQSLDIDDDFSSKQTVSEFNPLLVAVFVYVYFQLNTLEGDNPIVYADYSPPPLDKNIQTLYQTFLL